MEKSEIEMSVYPYLQRIQIKQHTPEWHEKREHLITASKVAGFLECSPHGPPITKSDLPSGTYVDSVATNFGILHEDLARKSIESRFNAKIYELGLTIHSEHDWLGASPDGIFMYQGRPCLVEIKCPYSRQISYKIPFEYWAQMQIQMEVWDIDQVLYSENEYTKSIKIDEDLSEAQTKGVLIKSWDVLVKRDSAWFARILPILKQNRRRLTKERRLFWNNSFNPNQIRNWITKDPILDWFDQYHSLDPNSYKKDPVKKYDLAKFAAKQTKVFHEEILKYFDKVNHPYINIATSWYDKVRPTKFENEDTIIEEPRIYKSYGKYVLTLRALDNQIPIISDAILVNEKINRWGKADLLIREDYLDRLFENFNNETNRLTQPIDHANKDSDEDNSKISKNKATGKRRRISTRDDNNTYKSNNNNNLGKNISKSDRDCDNHNESNSLRYRYYVVLTRFASLRLTADGLHLLNDDKQKLYKAHISFLTDCLPENLRINRGYIIGRKASWTSKGEKYRKDGFSNSIGLVSLEERDNNVPNLVTDSIEWLKRLREFGNTWRPEANQIIIPKTMPQEGILGKRKHIDKEEDDPGSDSEDCDNSKKSRRKTEIIVVEDDSEKTQELGQPLYKKPLELFPNMKNKHDHPWHNVKKRIAKETKEITEIFNIGPDKRNAMIINDGIYRWDQVKSEDLSVHKISDRSSVNNVLKANQEGILLGFEEVKEALNSYESYDLECYVDFETVTDLNEKIGSELFDTSPGIGGQSNIIYMIGCYVRNNKLNTGEYFNYLIKTIDPENEKTILTDWMHDLTKIFGEQKNIPIYHWSPAETTQLKRVRKSYGKKLANFIDRMNFIDLYRIFKDARVGIPGAFGYGLKTVAKALHGLGKIANTWEENLNGADAMVAAWYLNGAKISERETSKIPESELENTRIEKEEQPSDIEKLAKEIILYNYYDCKVMEEIVQYVLN